MIFSIQHYLEDYFQQRGLSDIDQYAVKVANFYIKLPQSEPTSRILKSMRRIPTVFFRNNSVNRDEFEKELLNQLNSKFKKKNLPEFPGGVSVEKNELKKQRRKTIKTILETFCRAVEARAVSSFWESRKQGKLAKNPEKIGQGLLALFTQGVLLNAPSGFILREVYSGIGFIDISIVLSSVLHIVEMKILTSQFTGASQLQTYMKTEGRKEGWLVVFDARPNNHKTQITNKIQTEDGLIRVVMIDINPIAPSQKSD